MKPLLIHGQVETTVDVSDLPKGLVNLVRPKCSAKLQRARAGHPPQVIPGLNPDDLIQLELEDGIILWVRAEDLERDFGLSPSRGMDAAGVELPYALPIGSASRGLVGDWIIKGLKIFEVQLVDTTTDIIKKKVEGALQPGPGLYRWDGREASEYREVKRLLKTGTAHEPWLVFIHGTASSTDGSFGSLWEGGANARMRELQARYAERVLAFQHPTLSQNPIQNAIKLAEYFPTGARLHLVSHSRGGLVGELLCRSMCEGRFPFDQQDFDLLSRQKRDDDREQLKHLDGLLREKQFLIERFVRVGCPARGTTLAGRRLDRYLSILFNVLRAIPGFQANPIYEGISAFIAAVVKNRTNPEELPGLEAQMPDSPLIQILNRPGFRTKADLHVLGGDLAGEGFAGRLKTFVTDLFYREDHDLVVNTPAMLGGAERTGDIQYWIDTGKHVDHFSYFRNPDTANRLVQALLKEDTQTLFHRLEREPSEVTEEDYRKRAIDSPQPVVYVLPGTMGSHLRVKKDRVWDRVWLDKWDLAFGGLSKLKHDAKHVEAEKPIGSGYKALIRFLANSHTVKPFAYDWRKSLKELADQFRRDLENTVQAQEAVGQPVRILAHSMGGLVVRVMLATAEGKTVWDRMCQHPGARFIMLGTPNGGSHAITAMLMGRDPLVRKLALLDIRNSQATLLKIISRFDGVLQLLPHQGSLDVFQEETWTSLLSHDRDRVRGGSGKNIATSQTADIEWAVPAAAQLAEAFNVKQLIQESPIDPQRMVYVAGRAAATPCNVSIDLSAPANRRIRVDATSFGDGRVPWDTGIPEPLKNKTYYVDCEHGDLANFPDIFDGLFDLLHAGATSKLSQTPVVSRGVSVERFEFPEDRLEMYPDERDLIASALGSSDARKDQPLPTKIKVSMIHGNLSRAASPVAVGHYTGDTIVSAEAYLDGQLNGRLRERQQLGLYPDALKTSAVVLTDGNAQQSHAHPGAIVVGLGMVGDLTPGGLTSTMADAVVNYALACPDAERTRRGFTAEAYSENLHVSLSLTSLLIGTGAGGLSLADSLQSILRGVLQANRRLKQLKETETPEANDLTITRPFISVGIERLDLMEVFADRAIQATKALLDLGRSQEFREHLNIHETMVEGGEGQQRASFEEDAGWWQRLRIATEEDGTLKFEALTNRARAETYLQPTQQKLIERFLKRAIESTRNDRELSRTLFELIIPNRMKEYAPDRRNMVLVVDEKSAAYPWELLDDGLDSHSRPLSVEAGMIRQMTIPPSRFREKVLQGTTLNALVIGDPTSQEPQGLFAPLPGAATEAREVTKLIRQQDYQQVVELVEGDATPDAILTALYQRPYRIVHCAAHGVFEFPLEPPDGRKANTSTHDPCVKPKTVTGMVLGQGLFLTPIEIEQMRFVPELVFLNCCHLGQTKGREEQEYVPLHRLAANLGTQLIRMGVRAVVAAGWAVNDAAAKTFAMKFYEEMFRNSHFGDAVRKAREEIYLRHGGSNTWGAYQCYGDPDFSFKAVSTSVGGAGRMVAPAELRMELLNLVQQTKTAGPKEEARLLSQLKELTRNVGDSWLESAAMCAALGQAYGELKQFPEAVRYYDRSRALQPADATVESLEQLANLKVRWARARMEQQTRQTEKTDDPWHKEYPIMKLFEDADRILEGLLNIQGTQERYALKGSIEKIRASLTGNPAQRQRHLEHMEANYTAGVKVGLEQKRADVYYPLQNRLGAQIVLSWKKPQGRGAQKAATERTESIEQGLAQLTRYAQDLVNAQPTFWNMCLLPDQQLLAALYRQDLKPDVRRKITEGYRAAKRRGGSAREMESVIKNIQFFEAMMETQAPPKIRQPLRQGLETLRQSLAPHHGASNQANV